MADSVYDVRSPGHEVPQVATNRFGDPGSLCLIVQRLPKALEARTSRKMRIDLVLPIKDGACFSNGAT